MELGSSQLRYYLFIEKRTVLFRSIAIQLVVFTLIFNVVSWIRASSMLSTDEVLTDNHYKLTTIMNESITLIANDKTTVIYFFAPWCQICHVSIGNLQALYEKNEHVDVIAVALDYMNADEIRAFSLKHQLTFPIALGTEQVKKSFKISGYPSYYVIDEQNTVIARSQGYSSGFGLYLRTL